MAHLDLSVGMDTLFINKYHSTITACEAKGVILKPYFGLRHPFEQAKLWRQSRATAEVLTKIKELEEMKCHFLALCLASVGPQKTKPWATNAIPGLSWHQYGVAMDSVWVREGKPYWSPTQDGQQNGYKVLATTGRQFGLTSLASIGDFDHLQLYPEGSPLHKYKTMQEIDRVMGEKFKLLVS